MMAIVRMVLGVVIGVAVGLGLVMAGDAANFALFPPPQPTDYRLYIEEAPFVALAALPIAYAIATLAAAFVGAKIGARVWCGWIAGGLIALATIANLVLLAHPLWFNVACVVLTPLAAWFGAKLARRTQPLTQ